MIQVGQPYPDKKAAWHDRGDLRYKSAGEIREGEREMNRIYQGKVTKVEAESDETPRVRVRAAIFGHAGNPQPLSKQEWQDALWQHHRLFQDAVNYYSLALAALSEGLPEKHPLIALRKRMAQEAWEKFPRKTVTPAKSLRDSLCPWLGLTNSKTFVDAVGAILPPAQERNEVRSLAVALLAMKVGAMKPRDCSKSYWWRFCDMPKRAPNWDYSAEELSRLGAAGDWKALLWQDNVGTQIESLARSLKLSSLVKCDRSAPELDDTEGRALLTDALAHLKGVINGTVRDSGPAKRTNAWLRNNKPLVEGFLMETETKLTSIPRERLVLESARGGNININKTHGAALLKAFPCDFTFAYMRAAVTKPKAKKKAIKTERSVPAVWESLEKRIKEIGDDPIKLSRLDGKPIFKAFTALESWAGEDMQPCWPDFDRCAFEEALKTLNQFNLKTEDREKRRLEVEAELKYMMGENPEWKPTKENEEADDREVPILKGDPRYEKLKKLLVELDEESAEHAVGEIYGPSRPSLRGFGKLREEWMEVFIKAQGNPNELELQEAVAALQREQRLDMGYTTFFSNCAKLSIGICGVTIRNLKRRKEQQVNGQEM